MKTRITIAVAALALVIGTAARADIVDELLQEDPLADISGEMTVVVRDLSELETGKPTQQKQGAIVGQLDKLIAELEKQCEACRGGGASGANPTKPLADSMVIGGPGGIGDLHAPRQGGKKWGELPPHERDRILQSMTEGFPAHYQRILEKYYRSLAEEKPQGEEPAADKDAKPAAEKAPAENGK